MNQSAPRALAALVFTVIVWGITPVLVRNISVAMGGWEALLIRLTLSSLVFAALLAFTSGFHIARKDLPRLFGISLAGMLVYYAFSIFGFEVVPAGVGTLIMATQPMVIAILARLIGAEQLRTATIIGIVISFLGSLLLVSGGDIGAAAGGSNKVLLGCAMLFLAGVGWSVFIIFSRPLIQAYGPLKITGLSNIISCLPVLPFLSMDTVHTLSALTPRAMVELGLLILLGHAVSVITWNYAVGHLRPTLLGASLYVVPLLAVASGWAILGEPVTLTILAAAAVILAGVAISQWRSGNGLGGPMLGYIMVISAVALWGLVPVAMRFLMQDVSPQTAMILRLVPAGLIAALVIAWHGMGRMDRSDWVRLAAASLIGNMGYQVLAAFGMQLIPASWTGMLFGLEPVFIALGAILFLGERPTPWFAAGLLLSLAGTGILVFAGSTGTVKDVSVLGVILVTLSTFGWAIYTILIRPVSRKHGAVETACLAVAVAALPTLAFTTSKTVDEIASLNGIQWLAVLYLSVFATVLAVALWNLALGMMDSAKAGIFLYLQPIIAAAGGLLLLGEELSPWLLGGGLLILLGVAVSQMKFNRAKPIAQPARPRNATP